MIELTEQDIIDINCLSSEAMKYTLSQNRDSSEAIEMQWYLRWMRDALFAIWVCSQTRVYDDLINATSYITNREYVKI